MASIEIPLHLKKQLQEQLDKSSKKSGFNIPIEAFTTLAIREKMERQFTSGDR
jgi:hypothetical protein